MNEDQLKQIVEDLLLENPVYTWRFWDTRYKKSLIATGVNLTEAPENTVIICKEEYPEQILISSQENDRVLQYVFISKTKNEGKHD